MAQARVGVGDCARPDDRGCRSLRPPSCALRRRRSNGCFRWTSCAASRCSGSSAAARWRGDRRLLHPPLADAVETQLTARPMERLHRLWTWSCPCFSLWSGRRCRWRWPSGSSRANRCGRSTGESPAAWPCSGCLAWSDQMLKQLADDDAVSSGVVQQHAAGHRGGLSGHFARPAASAFARARLSCWSR